ncbi:hypothetical protein [Aquimarina sp. MMG016]|uniref:hypothetical protein n=1 Tax=Aquimarina sp. MMG016 TaxID=2822690 RepID=UPI001B3A2713|nr:hypothetical protein [Aquimarina sp. MMG016]MBQ4820019.1 hypothetical protein [Aquimarina sp. MMG016]
MKIPIIGKGKYILITAKYKTGVILNNDGSPYLGDGQDYFLVKENKENAVSFAKSKVLNDDTIEILLYDGNGQFLEVFRPD